MPDEEAERRRLRWQCRRGLLELDLLLLRFLEERYPGQPAEQQDAFRRLLAQPDQALLGWIQGQQEPPPDLRIIINNITQ
jgi:antitoxin CptB